MFAPVDECVLYNEDCLETLDRGLQYHYVITSPPDFDEIGERLKRIVNNKSKKIPTYYPTVSIAHSLLTLRILHCFFDFQIKIMILHHPCYIFFRYTFESANV